MIPQWMAQAAMSAELEDHGVRYAWVITEEYDSWNHDAGRWVPIDGGEVAGPSTATQDEIARARTLGKPFRLDYDGDGPALRGRMWASDAAHPRDSEAGFAPLDDYGRGGYGATDILWRDEKGAWVSL
jgi:hypothetical protein